MKVEEISFNSCEGDSSHLDTKIHKVTKGRDTFLIMESIGYMTRSAFYNKLKREAYPSLNEAVKGLNS